MLLKYSTIFKLGTLAAVAGVLCLGKPGIVKGQVWGVSRGIPEFNIVTGALSAHTLALNMDGNIFLPLGGVIILKPAASASPSVGSTGVRAGRVISASAYDGLYEKYAKEYKLEKAFLKKIAYCESSYNPRAVNGVYGGMYQFLASTWTATRKQMGLDGNPDLRFEAEEAIRTAAYKISREGAWAWPVCGRGGS